MNIGNWEIKTKRQKWKLEIEKWKIGYYGNGEEKKKEI